MEEPQKQNLFQAFGGYMKQSFKGGKKKMKKEELKELPKIPEPPKFSEAVLLNEEELKLVPEEEKDMYLSVKKTKPLMAEGLLEEYRKQKEIKPEYKLIVCPECGSVHAKIL